MSWEQVKLETIKLEHQGIKKNTKYKINYCNINT